MAQQGPSSEAQFLYVYVADLVDNPPKLDVSTEELHREHVAYLQDLHDRGLLLGSGPKQDAQGNRYGGAVVILQNVATIEEAREIASREPNIREGLRTFKVYPWKRMWFEP